MDPCPLRARRAPFDRRLHPPLGPVPGRGSANQGQPTSPPSQEGVISPRCSAAEQRNRYRGPVLSGGHRCRRGQGLHNGYGADQGFPGRRWGRVSWPGQVLPRGPCRQGGQVLHLGLGQRRERPPQRSPGLRPGYEPPLGRGTRGRVPRRGRGRDLGSDLRRGLGRRRGQLRHLGQVRHLGRRRRPDRPPPWGLRRDGRLAAVVECLLSDRWSRGATGRQRPSAEPSRFPVARPRVSARSTHPR